MTIERKIVFGLEEIKAIMFECSRCHSRMSIPPDKLDSIPQTCPNGHIMRGTQAPDFAGSLMLGFLMGLKKLKDQSLQNTDFKILLELEEPRP
jgi:hypothetical protein